MWNWYEYTTDTEGDTKYHSCKRCKQFPAISLTWQDDNEYDAYCKGCWFIHIEEQFDSLSKKLDDENWGSLPEICLKCKQYFPNRLGMVNSSNNIIIDLCKECYGKYT